MVEKIILINLNYRVSNLCIEYDLKVLYIKTHSSMPDKKLNRNH